MLRDLLATSQWKSAEARLARRFGLSIYPANDRIYELIEEEIDAAEFGILQVANEFEQHPQSVETFCAAWYADAVANNYGEEFDPAEGDQQTKTDRAIEVIGITEGFMVGYILHYLYAKYAPDRIESYVKRRRIPHARKVAKDILRVFAATVKGEAG